MAADLMALLCDPLCQFRILPDAVAAEEEGSFYIPFRQPIQQRPGIRGKSGLITTLAGADGYFCISRDCEGIPQGAEIQVTILSGV